MCSRNSHIQSSLYYRVSIDRTSPLTGAHTRPHWWGGVVNLFSHVTAFNQSDYSIDQSYLRTVVTCPNKFTTPLHKYGRLFFFPKCQAYMYSKVNFKILILFIEPLYVPLLAFCHPPIGTVNANRNLTVRTLNLFGPFSDYLIYIQNEIT